MCLEREQVDIPCVVKGDFLGHLRNKLPLVFALVVHLCSQTQHEHRKLLRERSYRGDYKREGIQFNVTAVLLLLFDLIYLHSLIIFLEPRMLTVFEKVYTKVVCEQFHFRLELLSVDLDKLILG